MDLTQVELVRSSKGQDMLCVDDFLYHFKHRGKKTFQWVCNKRKDKYLPCQSRIITTLTPDEDGELVHCIVKVNGEHLHPKCTTDELSKAYERMANFDGEPITLQDTDDKQSQYMLTKNPKPQSDMESMHADAEDDCNLNDISNDISNDYDEDTSKTILIEKHNLYLLKTKNGRQMICLGGFLYRLNGKSQKSETYRWECIRHRDIKCAKFLYTECTQPTGCHRVKQVRENVKHIHGPYTTKELSKFITRNNMEVASENEGPQKTLLSDRKKQASAKRCQNAAGHNLSADPLSVSKEKSKLMFLPSAKGNNVLCFNNYIYHIDSRTPRNGRTYWTCILRRDRIYKCNGRVTTEMTTDGPVVVKVSGTHKHPDGSKDIKRRLLRNSIKNKVNALNKGASENIQCFETELGDDPQNKKRTTDAIPFESTTYADDDSTSSFASALEFDDTQLDNTPLPTKLEDMCEKVQSPIKKSHKTTVDNKPKLVETEIIWNTKDQTADEKLFEKEFSDEDDFNGEHSHTSKPVQSVSFKTVGRSQSNEKEYDLDMDINKISKLRSAKGGELLCVDGYIYYYKNSQNLRTYWVCIKGKDRVMKCKSRVSTIDTKEGIQIVRVTNRHSHPVIEHDIQRRLINEYGKSKGIDVSADASNMTKNEILKSTMNKVSEKYADITASLMSATQIRRLTAYESAEFISVKEGKMKLYAVSDGPPSLAVRMTLKALKIPYDLINVDYIAAEHMSEEYAKMNPQKEIPVLDDNGFYLPESIAIMQYICDKYGSNNDIGEQLYPRDVKQRAIVNHRLCFNMSFYYASISMHAMAPIFFDYKRTEMSLKKVNNALLVFETYLKRSGTKYAAADHVTIADCALVSSTLCLEAINFDLSAYPVVKKWYDTFKQEQKELWDIAKGGMQEIAEFEKNPPDLSRMSHPFHPTRKMKS